MPIRKCLSILLAVAIAGCSDSRSNTKTGGDGRTSVQSEWSAIQGGVRSRLTLAKDSFFLKEKMDFSVEVQNASDVPVSFKIRDDPGCIRIVDSNDRELKYVGPRGSHSGLEVSLRPNEIYTFSLGQWPENYSLGPGRYQAYFFEEEPADGNKTIVLKTPSIPFEVRRW